MATTRDAAPEVTQFVDLCSQFTKDAGNYAASGVYNAETDANIRQLLVAVGGLQAALNAVPWSVRTPPQAPPA